MSSTVVYGGQSAPVVTFAGTEDETSVLSGFTIRGGKAAYGGGGICGGEQYVHAHATIENNAITGNSAEWSGGICWCDDLIQNNTIYGNVAGGDGIELTWNSRLGHSYAI